MPAGNICCKNPATLDSHIMCFTMTSSGTRMSNMYNDTMPSKYVEINTQLLFHTGRCWALGTLISSRRHNNFFKRKQYCQRETIQQAGRRAMFSRHK